MMKLQSDLMRLKNFIILKLNEFAKKRWFFLIIGIVLVIFVVFVMALFGWRITYAPELENSWDAISTVANWIGVLVSIVGVVASFVAIWFAIQVPKEIADQQNKIALFEKRYEIYKIIQKCISLYYTFWSQESENGTEDNKKADNKFDVESANMKDENSNLEKEPKMVRLQFLTVFDLKNISDQLLKEEIAVQENISDKSKKHIESYKENADVLAMIKCTEIADKLSESEFLFAGDSEIIEYAKRIALALKQLIATTKPEDYSVAKEEFAYAITQGQDNTLKKIQKELEL